MALSMQPEPRIIAPGSFIGKYRVAEEVGLGGFGAVYRAEDPGTGRRVAIKVLTHLHDPELIRRFTHEARITGALNHPRIVTLFEFSIRTYRLLW